MRVVVAAMLAVVLTVACPVPPTASGADVPEWPSEREDRLNQVESEVIEVQRQLAVARRNQDADAVEKLSKQFKELQDERAKLLRATGALPE